MVLADREHVEAQLIRQLGLLEQVAHPLLGRKPRIEIGEGDESEIHTCVNVLAYASIPATDYYYYSGYYSGYYSDDDTAPEGAGVAGAGDRPGAV